mgnify:CR=1 FL=1
MKQVIWSIVVGMLAAALAGFAGEPLTIWFDRPATNWERETLPLGNGRLGAMVFGGADKERLQLNEESLWAGVPVEAWPKDYFKHLQEVRRLLFAGKNVEAVAELEPGAQRDAGQIAQQDEAQGVDQTD